MKNRVLVLFSLLILGSCSEDFLDRKPLSQLTVDQYYKTESDALAATLAVYSVLQGPRFYGKAFYNFVEIASDDANHKNQPDAVDNFIWSGVQGSPGSADFEALWAICYEGVYRANLVLENVSTIEIDENKKKQMLAEARFLRALYYWHLVNLFGDVPYVNKVAKSIDELYIPKSTVADIYKRIEEDLILSETDLPESWDAGNLGRATKYAAKSLLGKVYLYQGGNDPSKWSQAAEKLGEVVNSGKFKLMPVFSNIFSPNYENTLSSESIFEIQYGERGPWPPINGFFTDGGIAGEGSQRSLVMGIQGQGLQKNFGEVIAEQDLFGEFEVGDPRLYETIYYVYSWDGSRFRPGFDTLLAYADDFSQTEEFYRPDYALSVKVGGNPRNRFFHIKKGVFGYVGIGSPLNDPTNWRMIRYSDVLLMYAEALAESGQITNAITHLNKLRETRRQGKTIDIETIVTTAGVADTFYVDVLKGYPYTAATMLGATIEFSDPSSLEDFRKAIVHERRVELAFEYHRFFDLKRWDLIPGHPGGASTVFSTKPEVTDRRNYIKEIHSRCPIPQYQIDLSKGNLIQNPGY